METIFHTAIHLEMDKPRELHKILIGALHSSIQDSIATYSRQYKLVNLSKYVYFHMNEWFLFIYMRSSDNSWVRIDIQIY